MERMKLNIQLFGTWGSDKVLSGGRVWGSVGYNSVSRSGNTITVTWGSRIKTNYSTYNYQLRGSTYWKLTSGNNSNSGGDTGTRYYGYAKSGISKNAWYYTKNGNTSSTNTTERYDFTASLTLPSASTTTATLETYVWGTNSGDCYPTVTVTVPAATSPTISTSSHSSVSATTRGGSNGSHSWNISATSGDYASISSYSSSCNGGTNTTTSPNFSGLYNNTTYSWSSTVYNNAGLSASTSGSFYLTPLSPANPTIGTPANYVRSGDYYSATVSMSSSYDTKRVWNKWNVNGVTVTSSSNSQLTLSSLEPNKTYTITASVIDANSGGAYSTALTSGNSTKTFTTPCKMPSGLNVSLAAQTTSSLSGTISANGDKNAPITSYVLYYQSTERFNQLVSQGYTITSMINDGLLLQANLNGTNWSAFNLTVDTEYTFIPRASNAGGTATGGVTSGESVFPYSTNLDSPVIRSFIATSVTPMSAMVSVNAYSASGRVLNYQYSKDNGATWSNYSSNTTYLWENLEPETHYIIKVRVKAIAEGSGSDSFVIGTIEIDTPADQAKLRLKIDGEWKRGRVYIKVNNIWKPAKKIYRKINGIWTCGSNYDIEQLNINNDMTTWNAKYPERGIVEYDNITNINTITVTGQSGWEHYYIPFTCVVGKKYKVEIDWQTPSGYVPLVASGLTGIYAVVYDGVPGTSGYDTIAEQIDATKRISLPVDYNGRVYSTIFRATKATQYLSINFGGLQDGALYAASFRIKNIKITYYEN